MRYKVTCLAAVLLLCCASLRAEQNSTLFLPSFEKPSASNLFLEAGSGFCAPIRFFNQGVIPMTGNGYHFLAGFGYNWDGWLIGIAATHDRWGESLKKVGLMETFKTNIVEFRVRRIISNKNIRFLPGWFEIVPGFGLGADFISTDYYPSLRAKEEGKLKSIGWGDPGTVCFFYRVSLELTFPIGSEYVIPFTGCDYNAFYDESIGGGFVGYGTFYLGFRVYPFKVENNIKSAMKNREISHWGIPEATLQITPETSFTPDGDGVQDEAVLLPGVKYLQYPPQTWEIKIYDQQDHLIRTFSGEGKIPSFINWDGKTDDGETLFSKNLYTARFVVIPDERDIERTTVNQLNAEDTIETGILFQEIIPEKQWKIIVNTIYFDPDKATFNKISAEQRKANNDTLDSIAFQLSMRDNVTVVVQGYANNVSNTEWENRNELIPLSRLRAKTIMELLIKRGIEPSILDSEGLGGSNPIAAWEDRQNWWKNRRVEFIVTKIEDAE